MSMFDHLKGGKVCSMTTMTTGARHVVGRLEPINPETVCRLENLGCRVVSRSTERSNVLSITFPPDNHDHIFSELKELHHITHLTLSGPITRIPEGVLDGMAYLLSLSINRTGVEHLPEHLLQNNRFLHSLRLHQNHRLGKFPSNLLSNCHEMIIISVRGCGINEIPDDFLGEQKYPEHIKVIVS